MPRSLIAVIALLLLAAPVTAQQQPQSQEKASPVIAKGMADGVIHGQALAEREGTGGSLTGGLAGGLLLGLIGTAIAVVAQSPNDLPAAHAAEASKYGAEYQLGVQQGFAEKSKKRKKSAALTGGLLGTALMVTVVLSAGS